MMSARKPIQRLAACCGASLVVLAAMTAGMRQAPTTSRQPVQTEAPSRTPSPHGAPDGCNACHAPQAGPPRAIPRDAVDLLCLSCHDGIRATREPHPIGRPAEGPRLTRPPADWPLIQDRLSCLTCHDVVAQCATPSLPREGRSRAGRSRAGRSELLREPPAGKSFCGTCHFAASAPRHNPHRMTSANGAIDAAACRFCHTGTMTFGAEAARTGEARLSAKEITLCGACHARHVDFFEPGHIGAHAPPDMLERLRHRAADENVADGAALSAALPLDRESRVTCSTCHNPHERGIFGDENALSAGALSFPKPAQAEPRLRAHPPDLCGACHEQWNR